MRVELDRPLVTFTFDDFPRSALRGADIVEAAGGRAGFYACTSFTGCDGMFRPEDIRELLARGHEVGAHSHSHLDLAKTPSHEAVADIDRNLDELEKLGVGSGGLSLAYPYGETTFPLKRALAHRFTLARGVLPGLNVGIVDRMQLRTIQLYGPSGVDERAHRMLDKAIEQRAWAIFFSHEVMDAPSTMGTTETLVKALVRKAVDAGAILAAPGAAAKLMWGPH